MLNLVKERWMKLLTTSINTINCPNNDRFEMNWLVTVVDVSILMLYYHHDGFEL